MGRPGAGGGGGSRSSAGHSSARSSSGHRVGGGGSSSRPRGGSGSGGSFGSAPRSTPRGGYGGGRGGYGAPPPPRPPRRGRTVVYGGGPVYRRRSSCSGFLSTIMMFVIVFVVLIVYAVVSGLGGGRSSGSSGSIPSSSYNREKLDSGNGYMNDCIIDQLGWFDSESRTESRLKTFYEKTGVQPYIILLEYDSSLKTDAEKEERAQELYDEYIDNESTFLYVYFGEAYEDTYSEPGYMCVINGRQTGSVMDSEAIDIFWAYLDQYWYSDLSTDDMFVKCFESTAGRIMTKTTTKNDVIKYVLIVAAAGIVVFGVIKVVKLKHKRAKEEAEETERILNTPMESLVEKELEETAKKYDEQTK